MPKKAKEYMPRKVVEHHPRSITEEDVRRGAGDVQRILRLAYAQTLAKKAEEKNGA